MEQGQLNWIANFIWGIADDVLRDLYVRGKYRIAALGRDLDVRQVDHAHVGKLKKHLAEQKLASQLRRFKQRLTDHHRGERPPPEPGGAGTGPEGLAAESDEALTYEDVIDEMRRGDGS